MKSLLRDKLPTDNFSPDPRHPEPAGMASLSASVSGSSTLVTGALEIASSAMAKADGMGTMPLFGDRVGALTDSIGAESASFG
jgi:hypothetical protein